MSRLFVVRLDHRPDEVFQRRTRVVQGLPDENGERGRNRLGLKDVRSVPAVLEIDRYVHTQRVSFRKLHVLAVEGVQACPRAVELGLEWG